MSHGSLKIDDEGNMVGTIQTLKMTLDIKLVAIPHNQLRENGPMFNVFAKNFKGQPVKIGAAWEKRKDEVGAVPFYSITVDDPNMDAPLNITAFASDDVQGKFDLVWSRPRKKAA